MNYKAILALRQVKTTTDIDTTYSGDTILLFTKKSNQSLQAQFKQDYDANMLQTLP